MSTETGVHQNKRARVDPPPEADRPDWLEYDIVQACLNYVARVTEKHGGSPSNVEDAIRVWLRARELEADLHLPVDEFDPRRFRCIMDLSTLLYGVHKFEKKPPEQQTDLVDFIKKWTYAPEDWKHVTDIIRNIASSCEEQDVDSCEEQDNIEITDRYCWYVFSLAGDAVRVKSLGLYGLKRCREYCLRALSQYSERDPKIRERGLLGINHLVEQAMAGHIYKNLIHLPKKCRNRGAINEAQQGTEILHEFAKSVSIRGEDVRLLLSIPELSLAFPGLDLDDEAASPTDKKQKPVSENASD